MKYTYLGTTGIEVSRLCLGTMTFGRESDAETSRAVFDRAVDAGVNFFDCANVYASGESERLLGQFLRGRRDQCIVTSKCGFASGEGPRNHRGLSRRHIMQAIDASLARLGTDYLDLYFAHYFDAQTPVEEILRAMDDLVSAGKIRHFGVSNWSAWQIMKALGLSHFRGWNRIACVQPMYNLVKRQAEVEILPMTASEGLGAITYSPLGGGLLTGKHRFDRRPEGSRLATNEMYGRRYGDIRLFETAEKFQGLAEEKHMHCATLAVAWVAKNPAITAPIIGARNLEQLEPVLAAGAFDMDPELYQTITAFSETPPPATDRSEER